MIAVIFEVEPAEAGMEGYLDIAVGLRTPATEAEKIKQKYGCALQALVERELADNIAEMSELFRRAAIAAAAVPAEADQASLDPTDPGVPSVLDLDGLIELLVGADE